MFSLDQFSEVGQTEPALPANTESLRETVSPEKVDEAIKSLVDLGEEINARAEHLRQTLAHANAIAERRSRNRQGMGPRKRRRRR